MQNNNQRNHNGIKERIEGVICYIYDASLRYFFHNVPPSSDV
jgi:hypothetical protein